MTPPRVAVVGCGFWGMKMLTEYNRLREEGSVSRLVACDVDPSRIVEVTTRFPEVEVFADHRKIADSGVDCAHVLTPNGTHYPITSYLFSRGIHCLTEKPLTEDYRQSRDLVAEAAARGLVFKTGYTWRFTNVLREAKRMLDEGALEETQFVRFGWHSYTNHMVGVSIVWDQLPHLLNLHSFLFGETFDKCEVEQLSTESFRQPHSELMHLVLRGCNRMKVIIDASWLYPRKERVIEIYGLEGGQGKLLLVDMLKQTIQHTEGENLVLDYDQPNNTLYEEAKDFVNTVENGLGNGTNSAESALPQLRVVEEISKLDRTGLDLRVASSARHA